MADGYLNDQWKLWYHSPEDDRWTLESYVPVMMVSSVDDMWVAVNSVGRYIKDGMFFLSRAEIMPIWDDPGVRDGGRYSVCVPRERATDAFVDMMFAAAGETALADDVRDRWEIVCCVSISPKNAFNVIKIWLSEPDPPPLTKIWIPASRTGDVLFALQRDSIVRSAKPPSAYKRGVEPDA